MLSQQNYKALLTSQSQMQQALTKEMHCTLWFTSIFNIESFPFLPVIRVYLEHFVNQIWQVGFRSIITEDITLSLIHYNPVMPNDIVWTHM